LIIVNEFFFSTQLFVVEWICLGRFASHRVFKHDEDCRSSVLALFLLFAGFVSESSAGGILAVGVEQASRKFAEVDNID
jgi:hypothetical protein